VADSCEHGNGPSGSIKCWEFLERLSNCWLLTEDSGSTWYTELVVFMHILSDQNAIAIPRRITLGGSHEPFEPECERIK
jgi:hypothetical protein